MDNLSLSIFLSSVDLIVVPALVERKAAVVVVEAEVVVTMEITMGATTLTSTITTTTTMDVITTDPWEKVLDLCMRRIMRVAGMLHHRDDVDTLRELGFDSSS